jgi:hypothetical protein
VNVISGRREPIVGSPTSGLGERLKTGNVTQGLGLGRRIATSGGVL